MKKNIFTVLLLLCGLSVTAKAQETQKSFKVEVSNGKSGRTGSNQTQ